MKMNNTVKIVMDFESQNGSIKGATIGQKSALALYKF